MHVLRFTIVAVGCSLLLLIGCSQNPEPSPKADDSGSAANVVASDSELPALSSTLPVAITVTQPVNLENLQHDFDVMSWDSFIALNWPATADGQPDPGTAIGQDGDNATVWQFYKDIYQIFLPKGATPAPWGTPRLPPADWPDVCKKLFQSGMVFLTQLGKTPLGLSSTLQPFSTGPLIDQNGRYARFDIVVNKSMFDYIVNNNLYSKSGQKNVTSVVFPCSDTTGEVGSIMIKSSWKILSDEEKNSGRYHVNQAVVYTPASTDPLVAESCELVSVGLVGLHVVHKTGGEPQWVWSTFEQVDNCPTNGEAIDKPRYNFYNPNDTTIKINNVPARPWNPNNVEPVNRRSQVMRMIPISPETRALNAKYQAALRRVNPKSVWQYYELISTQWPTNPAKTCDVETSAPVDRTGTPAPQFLGNSTLETFIQGKVPNVSSSCMECHANATTTTSVFSDFTFLLERAH